MANCKIAFCMIDENPSIIDCLIAKGVGGLFWHCEIIFSNGAVGHAGHNKRGVSLLNVADRDYDSGNWEFFEIPANDQQEEIIYQYFVERQFYRYNMKGVIVSMVFGLNSKVENAAFCSEACLNALEQAKVLKIDINSNQVSPNFLYELVQKKNWKKTTWRI